MQPFLFRGDKGWASRLSASISSRIFFSSSENLEVCKTLGFWQIICLVSQIDQRFLSRFPWSKFHLSLKQKNPFTLFHTVWTGFNRLILLLFLVEAAGVEPVSYRYRHGFTGCWLTSGQHEGPQNQMPLLVSKLIL